MAQKYKVFLEGNYILFTDFPCELPIWEGSSPTSFEELLSKFEKSTAYQVPCRDPKTALLAFFTHFKPLQTAGALVQKENEDAFLWMQRLGHLDLPKGKIEKGEGICEAAIREIREETGLSGSFVVQRGLPATFHVYTFKGKSIFKTNHWFHLSYNGSTDLTPQIEEAIEAVFWLRQKEWQARLDETYGGLREMLSAAY
ncbi:MAG: NUDIX hydrolase [Flavobacteriales bacterium]